jgi:hypothetical protein
LSGPLNFIAAFGSPMSAAALLRKRCLHPDCEPWVAHSDIWLARALASLICSSESAIDAYLMFGLAEAKALIIRHRDAVLAIANTLMIHRILGAVMIHENRQRT